MPVAADLVIRAAEPADVASIRAFWLAIFEQDYGYGYRPAWHWDYDDVRGVYLDNPRHALWLALDGRSGALVGTAGLRAGGPRSPAWLAARYRPPVETAQLVRVFTRRDRRRRGVARRLVDEAVRFARQDGDYRAVCLHTESAVDFWLHLGWTLVHDGRSAEPPEASVHFELPLPARSASGR